jgi:hypothetical protein
MTYFRSAIATVMPTPEQARKSSQKEQHMLFFRPRRVNTAQFFINAPKLCAIRVHAIYNNAPAKGKTGQVMKLTSPMHYFFPTERFNACYSIALYLDSY